jgi:transposase-like protein
LKYWCDLEEMLAERGLPVDHVTVWRWVQQSGGQLRRSCRHRTRRYANNRIESDTVM